MSIPKPGETVARVLVGDERKSYYYVENARLMTFQSCFPSINMHGHQVNMKTCDFPVRRASGLPPFDPVDMVKRVNAQVEDA